MQQRTRVVGNAGSFSNMLHTFLLLAVLTPIFFAGCASSDEMSVSRLLAELEMETRVETQIEEAIPDEEMAALPKPVVESSPKAVVRPSPVTMTPDGPVVAVQEEAPVTNGSPMPVVQRGVLTVQPDCLLQINIDEDPTLDGNYPVNEIGAIQLGYVGAVILANKSEAEAAAKIADVLKLRDFKKASVKVGIVRAAYDKVKISGAVNKPKTVRIGAGDTISLNDAFLRAGGLTPAAYGGRVRIVRGGLLSAVASSLEGVEYSLMTVDGKPMVPGVKLRNNDVAFIIPGGVEEVVAVGAKQILVLGEVRRPGVYEFSSAEPFTLMHLLFKLGKLPPYANTKAIKVVRADEDGLEIEFKVNGATILEEGDPKDDFPLQAGDRIVIPARTISIW